MKKFLLSISLLFALSALAFQAQAQSDDSTSVQTRQRWFNEVRNYKYEFFAKEMELTDEQQQAFFPEYEAMEKAIYSINRDARSLERKIATSEEPVSDMEYEAAAEALFKVKQKEGEIEMEYFKKFEQIVSYKQLFLLKQAEDKFTRRILNHHRKGR